jgi:adenylate cyclase
MASLRAALGSPVAACAAIGFAVFALIAGARLAGWLEALELAAYDAGIRAVAQPADEPRIAIVEETEDDLRRWGFPMTDALLARLLAKIGDAGPVVIGVDKYRDIPVPPGEAELERLLANETRIVWITKFGGGKDQDILAPKALRGTDRVGFNDLVDDPGGIVRRGLLFLDDGKRQMSSFALLLALRYLDTKGLRLGASPRNQQWVRLGETDLAPFEASDGGYARGDSGGYQFLLDFVHAPRKFTAYSVTQVLEGKLPPDALRGRIVMIGATAVSLRDYFYTPFSPGLGAEQRITGIELQAMVTSQILRMALGGGALVRVLPDGVEYALLALLAIAGALLGYRGHSTGRFVLIAGGGLVAATGAGLALLAANWWVPNVPHAAAFVAAAAIAASYRSVREKRDRGVLMQLFSRHVSKSVAEDLWLQREAFMDGGRARPQQLTATVLFTDIRGFTTVSERMSAPELVEWLNDYMQRMAAVVIANGGVIDKYIGDAIMAVFGVPLARHSQAEIAADALSAVRCAWQMGEALEALNREFVARNLPPVGMRVGIFTGPLVAGSIGSSERLEYTVIGDTVNTASRLESYKIEGDASPCRILIGDPTLKLVADAVSVERVGAIALKGKEQAVTAYRVTGVK